MNVSRECTEFILNSKMNYIKNKSNILNDKKPDPKVYWTILNYFLNNINVPSIPPIFSNGKTITNIVDKANLFYDFFASQCTPLDNTSTLPPFLMKTNKSINSINFNINVPSIPPIFSNGKTITNIVDKANLFYDFFASQCTPLDNTSTLPPFLMKTNKSINSINFNGDDIISIIRFLDSKKAHGVDNISIRMIKLCGDSIILPLTLIFKDCIAKGIFPDLWKLAIVIPMHKKESKNIVKNYQPISLLPIFAKIFERLLFNFLFFHFDENKLFTDYYF